MNKGRRGVKNQRPGKRKREKSPQKGTYEYAELVLKRQSARQRRFWTLPATQHTNKRRRILFVCVAGQDTSRDAADSFKYFCNGKKLPMTLSLDCAGTRNQNFRRKLSRADFVVPTASFLKESIEKSMQSLKNKPKLIDLGLDPEKPQSNKKVNEKLFAIFTKE